MTLFKQKKRRLKFPKQEINPLQEMNQINSRVNFLIKKEQEVDRKTSMHQEELDNEISHIRNQMESVKDEIITIRTSIDQAKDNFKNAVKELNIHAKIEDLDNLRRMLQEYDPADFISYKEFQRIVEDKIKNLRL